MSRGSRARSWTATLALTAVCAFASAQSSDPLSPQDMTECANLAVSLTKKVEGVTLDYSASSLVHIDRILTHLHQQRLPQDRAETLAGAFGCYVGEVLIRNLNGAWVFPAEKERRAFGEDVFVRLPKGVIVNPIGKVRKFMQNGIEDSVVALYQVAQKASQ